jgi:hypothetical protein
MTQQSGPTWLRRVPAARWLAGYGAEWLASDAVAGATLAAYAIPVSLAYAALAGLPPKQASTAICWVESATRCLVPHGNWRSDRRLRFP